MEEIKESGRELEIPIKMMSAINFLILFFYYFNFILNLIYYSFPLGLVIGGR